MSLKAPLAQATETARAQGGRFQVLLGVFAALAALAWMALFPGSAARCGRELHQGIVLPLLFAAGAAAALRIRGRQCALLSFALVAAALLLPLWWRWFSGESDTMLVGGLLPYSDASDYLANAQRLASGERFTGDANNRPIATAMLAVLWKLTGGDYRLVLALIAPIPISMITDPFFFWAGKRYGRSLLNYLSESDPRWRKRAARGERFFKKYGVWTIVLAPFLPAPSPLFYMAAGEAGMSFALFIIADLIGTLAYIGLIVGAGWAIGQPAVTVAQTISNYALWVIVATVVLIVAWSMYSAWDTPRETTRR